jgi:hypothetical protein
MLRYITVFSLAVFVGSAASLPIDLAFGSGGGAITVNGTTHILDFMNSPLPLPAVGFMPSQELDTVVKGGPPADYGCGPNPPGLHCYNSNPTTSIQENITQTTGWVLGAPSGNTSSLTGGPGFLDIVDPTTMADIHLGFTPVNITTTGSGASTNSALTANLSYIKTTGTSMLAGWNLLNSELMKSTGGSFATQSFVFSGDINALYSNGAGPIGYTSELVVTPEPAFYGLLGLGMSGIFVIAMRRKKSVS